MIQAKFASKMLQNLYRRSTLATANDKRLENVVRRGRGGGSNDDEFEEVEGRGSLPNLVELEVSGVHLRREEAARLASQQRQELQRLLEEEQLLRSNPLRYLFHPAFRVSLSFIFCYNNFMVCGETIFPQILKLHYHMANFLSETNPVKSDET